MLEENKPLADVTAKDLKGRNAFTWVESHGLFYKIRHVASKGLYEAHGPNGELFEDSIFANIKADIRADSTPFVNYDVTVGSEVVGYIMNQHNRYFYRPAGTKGDQDSAFFDFPDDLLKNLGIPGAQKTAHR